MSENNVNSDKCIAGVPLSVFEALPVDDQNFLRAMGKIGVDLEVIYKKIAREPSQGANCE